MLKEILIVASISESIEHWGIEKFNGLILQQQGAGYYFVDVDEECERFKVICDKRSPCHDCEYCTLATGEGCPANYPEAPKVECRLSAPMEGACLNCVHPLPLKIAYFIMQAMRMQRNALELSIPPSKEGVEESLGHYLRIPKESQEDHNETNMPKV